MRSGGDQPEGTHRLSPGFGGRRYSFPHRPVEYTLTELGYSLKPILDAMQDWGQSYQKALYEEEKSL